MSCRPHFCDGIHLLGPDPSLKAQNTSVIICGITVVQGLRRNRWAFQITDSVWNDASYNIYLGKEKKEKKTD